MRIKEEENSYVVEPDEAKHEGVVKIYRDNATINKAIKIKEDKNMREFKMENETTIEVGETYRFADLWSGNGDEAEIFESGAVWIGNDEDDMPIVADFKVIEEDKENIICSLVKITDIF